MHRRASAVGSGDGTSPSPTMGLPSASIRDGTSPSPTMGLPSASIRDGTSPSPTMGLPSGLDSGRDKPRPLRWASGRPRFGMGQARPPAMGSVGLDRRNAVDGLQSSRRPRDGRPRGGQDRVRPMGWIKRTFHKTGSPRWFFAGSRPWMVGLYVVGRVADRRGLGLGPGIRAAGAPAGQQRSHPVHPRPPPPTWRKRSTSPSPLRVSCSWCGA